MNRTVSGAELSNPQIHTSSFLIEVFFKTAPGFTDGTLIQKMNDVGWALVVNQSGGVTLVTKSGRGSGESGEPHRRKQRPVAPRHCRSRPQAENIHSLRRRQTGLAVARASGLTLRWRTTLICMSAARRAVIA